MEDTIKAPAPAIKRETSPPVPKKWKYVGPKPAPIVSNLPGSGSKYHADEVPQQHVKFVIDTVPHAADWWVYE